MFSNWAIRTGSRGMIVDRALRGVDVRHDGDARDRRARAVDRATFDGQSGLEDEVFHAIRNFDSVGHVETASRCVESVLKLRKDFK